MPTRRKKQQPQADGGDGDDDDDGAEPAASGRQKQQPTHHNNNHDAAEAYAASADTILPLSMRAMSTLQDMGGLMRLSPLCHETPQREIRGWVLDIAGGSHASALFVPHTLFHGVTLALCETTEEEAFELMRDGDGTRARLAKAVEELMRTSKEEQKRATWERCRPRDVPASMHTAHRDREGGVIFQPAGPPIIDGEVWRPELSPDGFVGFYFRWHEGRLRLYVACQSYLPKACLEFFVLVHRAIEDDECTASMVCLSAEAQWLRSACRRNRERILAEVCRSMGVRVPIVQDYYAAEPAPIVVPIAETLHHDMLHIEGGGHHVRILNYCTEARTASNGSICSMAPWEGLWIFRGERGAADDGHFGIPYAKSGAVLPTASPCVKKRAPGHLAFTSADTMQCKQLRVWGETPKHLQIKLEPDPVFAHLPTHQPLTRDIKDAEIKNGFERALQRCMQTLTISVPNVPGLSAQQQTQHYLEFDEQVLERMARLGWNRSHGIVKLMPLGCALFEHYCSIK